MYRGPTAAPVDAEDMNIIPIDIAKTIMDLNFIRPLLYFKNVLKICYCSDTFICHPGENRDPDICLRWNPASPAFAGVTAGMTSTPPLPAEGDIQLFPIIHPAGKGTLRGR
jgi:hypothetical protein